MRNGYRIIDADRHVVEPMDLWSKLLPPALRAYAPEPLPPPDETLEARIARLGERALVPVLPMPAIQGKPIWKDMPEQAWIERSQVCLLRSGPTGALDDPATYLAHMDRTGVDIAFLFPGYALVIEGFAGLPPAVSAAFARAYNTWLAGFCALSPARLSGVGLVSLHDPAEMVPELERVVASGFRAVVVRPNPVGGRALSDPAYEPFWAACEARSVAVTLHDGAQSWVASAGADRFQSCFALHACAHPMEQMMALLALIEGGVLERHPGLRVAALEAGCGWLPYWLWRLDEVEYRHLRSEVAERVRMKPSEYFKRQYFAAIESDEPRLQDVVGRLGDDNLLFGSDFPHPDHDMDVVAEVLALEGELSRETLRKILWDNPARLFGVAGT